MKINLIALMVPALLLVTGCNKVPSYHGSTQAGTPDTITEEPETDGTGHGTKDYTARCRCLDCNDYITVLERNGLHVVRYSIDGRYGEFDVAGSEQRIVSNSNVDAVTEYLLSDGTGTKKIVLYVNEGRERVETVVEAGLEQDGKYAGLKCLASRTHELEESPNMDPDKFHKIRFTDEGKGLWMQQNAYSNMISLNYALLKIVRDHKFVDHITLRGRQLHLEPGERFSPGTDYSVEFKSDTIQGYDSPTDFSGLPTITTWSEEFGLEQEIRSMNVNDDSNGLDFSLTVYSPMFESQDTIRLHYAYPPDSERPAM